MSEEEKVLQEKLLLDQIESSFTFLERHITPKSNELLAVEELRNVLQGSMTAQDLSSIVLKIMKGCKFPNEAAENRALRDYCGLSLQCVEEKALNLSGEVTLQFLMRHARKENSNKRQL